MLEGTAGERASTPGGHALIRGALTPSPAVAFAIRSGVAVSAAFWLGKLPGLVENHSIWIPITVFVLLMKPTSGGSLRKGFMRAIGTVAAFVTSIVLFGLFAQDPPLLMAAFFVVQAIGGYGSAGSSSPYAWFIWALTTGIVLVDAMTTGLDVETVAFQRASMVAIGILLMTVVDSLIWPARAEPRLRQSVADRARRLGETSRRAVAGEPLDRGEPPPQSESLVTQLGLVEEVRGELGVSRDELNGLMRVALLLESVASRTRILAAPDGSRFDVNDGGRSLAEALAQLARRVEETLSAVAVAVSRPHSPVPTAPGLEDGLRTVEAERDRLQPQGGSSLALAGHVAVLRDLVSDVRAIEQALAAGGAGTAVPSRSSSWWRYRPDPFQVQIGLRTGIGSLATILATLALGWPVNTMVVSLHLALASLTRGSTKQTLGPVVALVLVAWGLADVLIVFGAVFVEPTTEIVVVPFVVAAACGYIAARWPQLALVPVVIGQVGLLPVYAGPEPLTNVYGPYSIMCYVALALGVGLLAGRAMWPLTAAAMFRERLATQLELCLDALRAELASRDARRARRTTELLSRFTAQAAQLGPLHQQARYERVEEAWSEPRRDRILALATDLMDAVLAYRPRDFAELLERAGAPLEPLVEAVRQEDGALVTSMQKAVDAMRGEAVLRPATLAAAHRTAWTLENELRDALAESSGLTDDERRRLLVEMDARRRLVRRQRAIEDWFDLAPVFGDGDLRAQPSGPARTPAS